MNAKNLLPILLALCLVLSGCSLFQPVPSAGVPVPTLPSQTPLLANPAQPKGSATATRTPRPTATQEPTIALSPTPTPTATPDPKVYAPDTFGDSRQLDSFVMKVNGLGSGSGAGQVESYSFEYEYNRSPLSIHEKGQDVNGPAEIWKIDNWIYFFRDHWSASPFHAKTDLASGGGVFGDLDMRLTDPLVKFTSANFVGQETYQGLPVYHFSFDSSNIPPSNSNAVKKVDTAQGEVLVSVDGNIPLYFQMTITGKILANANGGDYLPGQVTFTKALSAINQPVKIALPASYPNLAIEPGFSLPPGTEMSSVDLYGKVSQYLYFTQASEADFKSFYQNLTPTNGWTVEQTGPLQGNSYNCEVCAILSNGNEKVRVQWQYELNHAIILAFNPPELY